jgi:hypothetical protein
MVILLIIIIQFSILRIILLYIIEAILILHSIFITIRILTVTRLIQICVDHVAACYLDEIFMIRKNFANLLSINSFKIALSCNK